jgi:hypothetical protein
MKVGLVSGNSIINLNFSRSREVRRAVRAGSRPHLAQAGAQASRKGVDLPPILRLMVRLVSANVGYSSTKPGLPRCLTSGSSRSLRSLGLAKASPLTKR